MIDLHYSPTPNGWKVSIALEEMGLDYKTHLLNIAVGEQFDPQFLKISPNAKMPAIVDHDPPAQYGDKPVSVFESGAILFYLANKTGSFMPRDAVGQKECLEWLFWQGANQGPMAGQLAHFRNYAPENNKAYGLERYGAEANRNLGVLERRLEDRGPYLLGDDYSIADMIIFPWALISKYIGLPLDEFPKVTDWRERIKNRPAVQRGIALLKGQMNHGTTAETNKTLFNQSAGVFRKFGA